MKVLNADLQRKVRHRPLTLSTNPCITSCAGEADLQVVRPTRISVIRRAIEKITERGAVSPVVGRTLCTPAAQVRFPG